MDKKYYKESTKKIFDTFNSGNFSELENIMAEEIIFDFPGSKLIKGKRRVVLFLNALTRKFKGLKFEISEIISEDEKTCAVWSNSGKYSNGSDYKNNGITLVHFKENKIIFISDYFKDTSFTEK